MSVATETKPKTKEYVRPMPATWWLNRWNYTKFMLREATSIFIAGYCVFLLVLMYRAEHLSPDDFRTFYWGLMQHPVSVALHVIALIFAVIHSVTFFNLTPKVVIVRRGEERVPDELIAGAHYAAWAVVSLILIVLVLVL